ESDNHPAPEKTNKAKKTADFAEHQHHHSDIPAQMTDLLGENLQPVVSDWIKQVRELVNNATSLEQVRDELLTLMPEMSLEQYTNALAIALGAA
ncbi:portal protein, partial [Pasteurella multocida]|nr:portal protein [Pasteurella multocida]